MVASSGHIVYGIKHAADSLSFNAATIRSALFDLLNLSPSASWHHMLVMQYHMLVVMQYHMLVMQYHMLVMQYRMLVMQYHMLVVQYHMLVMQYHMLVMQYHMLIIECAEVLLAASTQQDQDRLLQTKGDFVHVPQAAKSG